MTPIEILATIFAILILFKLLLSVINPQARLKMVEAILNKNPTILTIIFLILTAIIGYYIFDSFTIVNVAAVMIFLSALMGLFFIQYKKIMIRLLKEELKSRSEFIRKNWLSILIWAGLAIWTLYTLFL